MKKYEHLGKSLSREEQKSIGGGLTQVANTICTCNSQETFPVCGTDCNDVYGQCSTYCNTWGVEFRVMEPALLLGLVGKFQKHWWFKTANVYFKRLSNEIRA